MLPGLSGWQFLERSREQLERANIPVVILSAIKGQGDYPSTLGVAAWLTKPLDFDRFLRAVEDLAGPSRPTPRTPAARVLVVEDEPLIRRLLVEHLAEAGYLLDEVGTIAEARAHVEAQPPALIVLDLMLPGRSGWDYLRERREQPALANIPVLVISAAPQDRLLDAKVLGADAFLSKPFDLDVLGALVRSFVS
jgi:DNA-binding response OmpR family regulator